MNTVEGLLGVGAAIYALKSFASPSYSNPIYQSDYGISGDPILNATAFRNALLAGKNKYAGKPFTLVTKSNSPTNPIFTDTLLGSSVPNIDTYAPIMNTCQIAPDSPSGVTYWLLMSQDSKTLREGFFHLEGANYDLINWSMLNQDFNGNKAAQTVDSTWNKPYRANFRFWNNPALGKRLGDGFKFVNVMSHHGIGAGHEYEGATGQIEFAGGGSVSNGTYFQDASNGNKLIGSGDGLYITGYPPNVHDGIYQNNADTDCSIEGSLLQPTPYYGPLRCTLGGSSQIAIAFAHGTAQTIVAPAHNVIAQGNNIVFAPRDLNVYSRASRGFVATSYSGNAYPHDCKFIGNIIQGVPGSDAIQVDPFCVNIDTTSIPNMVIG